MVESWPFRPLAAVPGEHIAVRLAGQVRKMVSDDQSACNLEKVCTVGGFAWREATLDAKRGGHEALLVPRIDGGFEIFVDPSPPAMFSRRAASVDRTVRRRTRFRIAHEIGHSFFYDRRFRPARRLVPWDEREEAFCDLFASALLIPPNSVNAFPCTPKAVLKIADTFDVSIEAAARAFSKWKAEVSILGLEGSRIGPSLGSLKILWSVGPARFTAGTCLGDSWVKLAAAESEDEIFINDRSRSAGVRIAKLTSTFFLSSVRSIS